MTAINKLEQILKKYGSGVVDNCLKIIDNPDYKFEKKHDKLHAEALKQITEWVEREIIGSDEKETFYSRGFRNELRAEQRAKLRLIKEKREK